jgi:predicted nuclease with TOPRIM domain
MPGAKTFTQEELDEIVQDRVKKTNEALTAANQKAADLESRLEAANEKVTELQASADALPEKDKKIAELTLDNDKFNVLVEAGLSPKLANNLTGSTKEELAASAKNLKSFMPKMTYQNQGGNPKPSKEEQFAAALLGETDD